MKGITQFLLGGLVGAAVGYLASQRRLRSQRLAVRPAQELETAPAAPAVVAPSPRLEPQAEEAVPQLEEALPQAEEAVPQAEEAPAAEIPEEMVAAPGEPPEVHVTPLDELKARIEETRRKIREELERPFFIAGLSEKQEAAVQTEPEAPPAVADTAPAASERPLDYESVKSRIEAARVKLKAKAFDAMVTGETPLLSRSGGPSSGEPASAVPPVDDEVEATIESALKEEET